MSWDERIARARSLAASHVPASSILTFYAQLAEYQQRLSVRLSGGRSGHTSGFDQTIEFDAAARAVPDFLDWLARCGPRSLTGALTDLQGIGETGWRDLMVERVSEGAIEPDDAEVRAFVVEAILQPFAETAARVQNPGGIVAGDLTSRRCPTCGGYPVVGALREEGHGTRRTLICALCATEWAYLRVRCVACDEDRFDALPVYTADAAAHVRIDACDTCHTYMKTVDLAREARAVPVADDLASVPLDLWARDRGYRRLYPNLLRL